MASADKEALLEKIRKRKEAANSKNEEKIKEKIKERDKSNIKRKIEERKEKEKQKENKEIHNTEKLKSELEKLKEKHIKLEEFNKEAIKKATLKIKELKEKNDTLEPTTTQAVNYAKRLKIGLIAVVIVFTIITCIFGFHRYKYDNRVWIDGKVQVDKNGNYRIDTDSITYYFSNHVDYYYGKSIQDSINIANTIREYDSLGIDCSLEYTGFYNFIDGESVEIFKPFYFNIINVKPYCNK